MSNRALKPLIENAWYLAAWSNELSEKPLARKIVNKHMVLFRDADGNAAALEDRCAHRAAPLSCGRVVKEGLQCGYHGMVFDKSGKCTVNPADSVGNLRVRSYRVEERQKFVWVWTGDQALADPQQIVDFPFHDDQTEWPFQFGYLHFKCNYMLVMDNLMDLTHLGYVHTKTIGGNPQAHDNAMQDSFETPFGARFERWAINVKAPPTFLNGIPFKGNIDRWSKFEYVAPSSVLQFGGGLETGRGAQQNQNQEGALRLRLYHGATPESESTCHYFWSFAHGYRQTDAAYAQSLYNELHPTFQEDGTIIELQQQALLREPDRPLIVRKHDKALVLAHKGLDRFAEAAAKLGEKLKAA